MVQYFTNAVKLYSVALFSYAVKNEVVSKVSQDFDKLEIILLQDPFFIKNISAPIYSESEQNQILSAALTHLKLSSEIVNFIYLLAKNKRLALLPQILKYFKICLSEHLGNKIIEVTVSDAVSPKEQEQLKQQFEKIFAAKVDLSFKQNHEILGGMIVKLNNQMFDASLSAKFASLTNAVNQKIALL